MKAAIGRTRVDWLIVALVTLSISLAGLNYWLVAETRSLRSQLVAAMNLSALKLVLQPGTRVPPLTGFDLEGNRIEYTYGAPTRKTLMFVFSPDCPACTEVWPRWRQLMQSLDDRGFRLVALDKSGTVGADYVQHHRFESVPLIARPDAKTVIGYNLNVTPQLILVDTDGVAIGAWSGQQLSRDESLSLSRALRTDVVNVVR